jgi:hypothetical protein
VNTPPTDREAMDHDAAAAVLRSRLDHPAALAAAIGISPETMRRMIDGEWIGSDNLAAVMRYLQPPHSPHSHSGSRSPAADDDCIAIHDDDTPFGALHEYASARYVRAASQSERDASRRAAESDGGAGVIVVKGTACYVQE